MTDVEGDLSNDTTFGGTDPLFTSRSRFLKSHHTGRSVSTVRYMVAMITLVTQQQHSHVTRTANFPMRDGEIFLVLSEVNSEPVDPTTVIFMCRTLYRVWSNLHGSVTMHKMERRHGYPKNDCPPPGKRGLTILLIERMSILSRTKGEYFAACRTPLSAGEAHPLALSC